MPDGAGEAELEVLMGEEEAFPPPAGFAERALANDPEIYAQAERDPEGWWASWAE